MGCIKKNITFTTFMYLYVILYHMVIRKFGYNIWIYTHIYIYYSIT